MDRLKSDIQILLSTLYIQNSEKLVTIIENGIADANFVLCHLLKHVFQDPNKALCLVMLHNTLGHYQNVGKRLNYNLSDKIKNNDACIVEPLNSIANDIGEENSNYLTNKSEDIAMKLFLTIEEKLKNLLNTKSGLIYLFIDDISHLLDLGVEVKHLLCLLNTMINFDERINLVIGTHVSGATDQILCNALTYISDVIIEVSPLKTGRSFHLSGILDLKRKEMPTEKFHFKATDRGVRLFRPGESLQYLKNY